MSAQEQKPKQEVGQVTSLYNEHEEWSVNKGDKTIHAKRMPGRFRTFKNFTESLWLIFFLAPYIRWHGNQALLLDVNNRQFHFFNLTILPQDIWMVSLLLLLMAMTLFAATSVASRVFCGYFCFQSTWVDWFTWIEEKVEGNPNARVKLDTAPMSADKFRKKALKHTIWLLISVLTGISFTIWFEDAFVYWHNLMHFNLSIIEWATLIAFTFGTYLLAGFMREQVCMWLCPYCRIQAVMPIRRLSCLPMTRNAASRAAECVVARLLLMKPSWVIALTASSACMSVQLVWIFVKASRSAVSPAACVLMPAIR